MTFLGYVIFLITLLEDNHNYDNYFRAEAFHKKKRRFFPLLKTILEILEVSASMIGHYRCPIVYEDSTCDRTFEESPTQLWETTTKSTTDMMKNMRQQFVPQPPPMQQPPCAALRLAMPPTPPLTHHVPQAFGQIWQKAPGTGNN